MQGYNYDLVVIGGGSAGLVGAKLAHGLGKKVAIIEKNKLGGECTWTGCVPSKAIIHAAQIAHTLRVYDKAGFTIEGSPPIIDSAGVMAHVREVIQTIYRTHTPEQLKKTGIDVILGEPQFIDAHTLQVEGQTITSRHVLLACGSRPLIPPIDGLDIIKYLTNETFFSLDTLPDSLIILGGGPIGVELASACTRLGVAVTLIEMHERLMIHEDQEIAQLLRKQLHREGVVSMTGKRAERVASDGNNVTVYCLDSEGVEIEVTAQQLLIATGRRPNIEGLGLMHAGVVTSKQGVVVTDRLQTTAKNIYAAGDIVGSYQFSHIAEKQAQLAVRNALLPFSKKFDDRHVCWVTFSAPELARAGLTEEQARAQHRNIQIFTLDFDQIDRAHTDGATFGRIKVICDKRYKILGVHILGERAGEIMHELQLAKHYDIPLYKLHEVMHAYPTYSDVIKVIAKKCYIEYLSNHWFLSTVRRLFGKRNETSNG